MALHSEPILEDLSKFLVEKYSYSTRFVHSSVQQTFPIFFISSCRLSACLSNPILLNNFVLYFSSDIVESNGIYHEEKSRLNDVLKAVPPKGSFDLRNVLKSIYFFS